MKKSMLIFVIVVLVVGSVLGVEGEWVSVKDLEVGDELFNGSSWVRVESIDFVKGEVDVFNMHVNGFENYFAEDVLVHNKAYQNFESYYDPDLRVIVIRGGGKGQNIQITKMDEEGFIFYRVSSEPTSGNPEPYYFDIRPSDENIVVRFVNERDEVSEYLLDLNQVKEVGIPIVFKKPHEVLTTSFKNPDLTVSVKHPFDRTKLLVTLTEDDKAKLRIREISSESGQIQITPNPEEDISAFYMKGVQYWVDPDNENIIVLERLEFEIESADDLLRVVGVDDDAEFKIWMDEEGRTGPIEEGVVIEAERMEKVWLGAEEVTPDEKMRFEGMGISFEYYNSETGNWLARKPPECDEGKCLVRMFIAESDSQGRTVHISIVNPDEPYTGKPNPIHTEISGSEGLRIFDPNAPEPTSCFIAGTLVEMADGSKKNIEEIEVGDEVLSWDFSKNEKVSGQVLRTWQGYHKDMYIVYTSEGKEISVSSEHPFWTVERGWASINPKMTFERHGWAPFELKEGYHFIDKEGNFVEVIGIKKNFGKIMTYNLYVEKYENYYAESYLVHNKARIYSPYAKSRYRGLNYVSGSGVEDVQWNLWKSLDFGDSFAGRELRAKGLKKLNEGWVLIDAGEPKLPYSKREYVFAKFIDDDFVEERVLYMGRESAKWRTEKPPYILVKNFEEQMTKARELVSEYGYKYEEGSFFSSLDGDTLYLIDGNGRRRVIISEQIYREGISASYDSFYPIIPARDVVDPPASIANLLDVESSFSSGSRRNALYPNELSFGKSQIEKLLGDSQNRVRLRVYKSSDAKVLDIPVYYSLMDEVRMFYRQGDDIYFIARSKDKLSFVKLEEKTPGEFKGAEVIDDASGNGLVRLEENGYLRGVKVSDSQEKLIFEQMFDKDYSILPEPESIAIKDKFPIKKKSTMSGRVGTQKEPVVVPDLEARSSITGRDLLRIKTYGEGDFRFKGSNAVVEIGDFVDRHISRTFYNPQTSEIVIVYPQLDGSWRVIRKFSIEGGINKGYIYDLDIPSGLYDIDRDVDIFSVRGLLYEQERGSNLRKRVRGENVYLDREKRILLVKKRFKLGTRRNIQFFSAEYYRNFILTDNNEVLFVGSDGLQYLWSVGNNEPTLISGPLLGSRIDDVRNPKVYAEWNVDKKRYEFSDAYHMAQEDLFPPNLPRKRSSYMGRYSF